jgi:hypothetical protein
VAPGWLVDCIAEAPSSALLTAEYTIVVRPHPPTPG